MLRKKICCLMNGKKTGGKTMNKNMFSEAVKHDIKKHFALSRLQDHPSYDYPMELSYPYGLTSEILDNAINQIDIDDKGFKRIKSVILKGNELTELPESFGRFANIDELDITETQISKLPECFSKYNSLKIYHNFADNILNKQQPIEAGNYVQVYRAVLGRIFLYADKVYCETLLLMREASMGGNLMRELAVERLQNKDVFEWGFWLMDGNKAAVDIILCNLISFEDDERKRVLKNIQKEAVMRMMDKDGMGWRDNPGSLIVHLSSMAGIEDEELQIVCQEYKKTKDKNVFLRYFNAHFTNANNDKLNDKEVKARYSESEIEKYHELCVIICKYADEKMKNFVDYLKNKTKEKYSKKLSDILRQFLNSGENTDMRIIHDIKSRVNYDLMDSIYHYEAITVISSYINFDDEKIRATIADYSSGFIDYNEFVAEIGKLYWNNVWLK